MAYKPKYDLGDSIAADNDADNAERMANAQSRLTQAEIRMAENRSPRMMELRQEQARNAAMGDVFAAARQRRLDSQRMTAIADPGRYAPSVRQEALEWQRKRGLREHELAMLDKQNKGMLDIQAEKTRTAGEAARQTGLTNIELEKLRGGYTDDKGVFHPGSQTLLEREKMQNGLTLAEKQLSSQERIAGMEHGTIGPDGKVTPGSRERVARIGAETNAQQAELQRQHEIEKQKIISDGNVKAAGVAAAGRVGAAEARGEQAAEARRRRFDEMALSGKFVYAGIGADKWKNMSEDEREKIRKQFFGQIDELNGTGAAPVKKSMSDYESK